LIANWTHFQGGQQEDYDYAGAVTAQVQYLFGPEAPKTSDGAVSHSTNMNSRGQLGPLDLGNDHVRK
jgi:hypothetical protein